MKLLVEQNFSGVESFVENNVDKPKEYFIEGIFLQADNKNRNGRIYPLPILEKEVERYIKESIDTNLLSCCGELNHRDDPSVDPERISHRNLSLRLEGKNFIGKAKILIDQPCGKIVKGLMDEGLKLGVSSRAIGSLVEKEGYSEVQNDLRLSTIDIVSEPSVSEAIVENIMESTEWDYIDGKFVQLFRENIRKAKGKQNLEEAKIKEFHKLINSFKIKI